MSARDCAGFGSVGRTSPRQREDSSLGLGNFLPCWQTIIQPTTEYSEVALICNFTKIDLAPNIYSVNFDESRILMTIWHQFFLAVNLIKKIFNVQNPELPKTLIQYFSIASGRFRFMKFIKRSRFSLYSNQFSVFTYP